MRASYGEPCNETVESVTCHLGGGVAIGRGVSCVPRGGNRFCKRFSDNTYEG